MKISSCLFSVLVVLFSLTAFSMETDQLTCRSHLLKIKDSNAVLSYLINNKFERARIKTLKAMKKKNRGKKWGYHKVARLLRKNFKKELPYDSSLANMSLKLEVWMDFYLQEKGYSVAPEVNGTEYGIYDQIDRWSRNNKVFPFWFFNTVNRTFVGHFSGRTFKINGILAGSDKVGHFLSTGYHFWINSREGKDFLRGLKKSTQTENGAFGQATTGVFSSGDLSANYMGYTMYKNIITSLDHPVERPELALFEWIPPSRKKSYGDIRRLRDYDLADYASHDWDEVVNYSYIKEPVRWVIQDHLTKNRCKICYDYMQWRDTLAEKRETLSPREEYTTIDIVDMDTVVNPFNLEDLCHDFEKDTSCNRAKAERELNEICQSRKKS